MSDKDRQKKDHERRDKQNQALKESVMQRKQEAQSRGNVGPKNPQDREPDQEKR